MSTSRHRSPVRARITAAAVLLVFLAGSAALALARDPDPVGAGLRFKQAASFFDHGQYLAAAEAFDLAGRMFAGTPFSDDAGFSRIRALEAAGQDSRAEEAWTLWLEENPASPLCVEATLALCLNHLRQADTEEARALLGQLITRQNWLAKDPRFLQAQALLAYQLGQWSAALNHLTLARQSGPPAAGALMLEGLCQDQLGQKYAAAVAYQELIDEHPGSHLAAYATMAKARIFPGQDSYRDAAQLFQQAAAQTTRADHRAENRYLAACCLFLSGQEQEGLEAMRQLAVDHSGSDLAARALFSMGEMRWHQGQYEQAIVRFNEVLSGYFAHELAGSALYRTARCLDALGLTTEANSTYQAVAQGHPYAPEAPAAIYLAGVGLYEQERYLEAATYFQLVMDRYAGSGHAFVFASPAQQELVEASLCLLEFSYHQAGETGLMAGAPHLALQKMPPSTSLWRAYTLLLDADALAAVDRYAESQETLATLLDEFPDHPVGIRANRLLAWTFARQGRQDLAIATEAAMLARYRAQDDQDNLAAAQLTMAHGHFNAKRYDEASRHYQAFIQQNPAHPEVLTALYQAGLAHLRCGRSGDAVDSWARITAAAPASEEARKAWLRSGDILFQTGHFDQARVCFQSLRQHFPDQQSQAAGLLRLGRCDYNEGKGTEALSILQQVAEMYPGTAEATEAVEGITNILYTLGLEGENDRLRTLVSLYPDSPLAPEAAFQLAWRLFTSDQYDAAARAFQDLAGRYPRYSAADRNFYYAAESLLKAGQPDQAFQQWQDFLAYFPHSDLASAALLNLGNLRFNRGQYHPAVQDFQQVLAREGDPEIQAAARFNLAMSQRILGQNAQARQTLGQYRTAAVEDDPRLVTVLRTMAEIEQEQGHHQEAARLYQEAASAGPDPLVAVELNYLAGLCLKEAGDYAGAMVAYATSIASPDKTNNFRLSALAQTADLCEQEGDFDGALAAYRDLVKHATDPVLAGAAQDRLNQLETALGR